MTLDNWITKRNANDGYFQRKKEVLLETEVTIGKMVSDDRRPSTQTITVSIYLSWLSSFLTALPGSTRKKEVFWHDK